MRLSWVIPAFNEMVELPECLDTILIQKRPMDEVIFVDDGSTDATPEILRKHDGHITIIRNGKRCGPGVSRNRGIFNAIGDVILMGDVALYSKNRTQVTEECFSSDPQLEVLFSYGIARAREEDVPGGLGAEVGNGLAVEWDMKGACHIPLPGVAGKRGVFLDHPFSERCMHHELYQKVFYDLVRCGHRYSYVPRNLVSWTRGTSHRDKKQANVVKDSFYHSIGLWTNYSGKFEANPL